MGRKGLATQQRSWEDWWYLQKWTHLAKGRVQAGTTPGGSSDASLPAHGLAALTDEQRSTVLGALRIGLTDRYPLARFTALVALGKLQSHEAVLDLLGALKRDTQNVRMGAVLGLGLSGQPDVGLYLRALLADSSAGRRLVGERSSAVPLALREMAAFSLGLTGDAAGRRALRELVTDASEPTLSAHAALGLALCKDRAAVPALVGLLADDQRDHRARAAAALALGQLGPRSTPVISSLVAALSERSGDVASASAVALGRLALPEDKAAVEALWSVAERGSTVGQRGEAVIALARIGGEGVAKRLRSEELQRGPVAPFVTLADAIAHAEFGDRPAAIRRAVTRLERSRSPEQSGAAGLALGLLTARGELEALRKAALAKNPVVRRGAVAGLGLLGLPDPSEDLREVIATDNDAGTLHEAALSLGHLGWTADNGAAFEGLLARDGLPLAQGAAAIAFGLSAPVGRVTDMARLGTGQSKADPLARAYAWGAVGIMLEERELPLLYAFREGALPLTGLEAYTLVLSLL